MINRTALLEDLVTGKYVQISVADFGVLLSHEAFSDFSQTRFEEPTVTLGDQNTLQANSGTVFCYTPKGTFQPITKTESDGSLILSLTTEQTSENPRITATEMPDAWSLTVRQGETISLSQDRVKTESLYFPTEPGIYRYQLTGHWDLTPRRDWYGDLNYVFEIHITEPEAGTDLPGN